MSKVEQIQKEIKQKTGSSTFCALPWVHVATETNGTMRLCCASNTKGIVSNNKNKGTQVTLDTTTITKEWNNEYYKNIRNEMLCGNEPIDCAKCFEQEKIGIVSKRLWETKEWIDTINVTNLSDVAEPPIYLDLRLGNTCNLKCTMCSPKDSSQWVKDYKELTIKNKKLVPWDKKQNNQFWFRSDFKDDLHKLIPNLKQVLFAGGEPLMIPEHKEFVQEVINLGYSKNIILKYNTNGVLVDDEIIDIWKQFKQVKVSVSLDGIYERGEYIRYPMSWGEMYNSLKLLDNTPDNIDVNIAVTVQILNIKHLIEFAKWKIQERFNKVNLEFIEEEQIGGGIFNMHLLYTPTFLSIQALPKEDKEKIRQDFLNFKEWLVERIDSSFWSNPVGWQKWDSILNYMDMQDRSELLPSFKQYIKNLDHIRNTKAATVFPELSHLFS